MYLSSLPPLSLLILNFLASKKKGDLQLEAQSQYWLFGPLPHPSLHFCPHPLEARGPSAAAE